METGCGNTHTARPELMGASSSCPNPFIHTHCQIGSASHHGTLDGSVQSIIDSCHHVCHRIQEVLECDSLLIFHRSRWRCLARTYSVVLEWLMARLQQHHASSSISGQEVLCQELMGSFEALHHAMREAEQCFEDCTCNSSNINHLWLLEKALKLGMSTDVIDIHLHDFIWAYALVMEQAFWLGIPYFCVEFHQLERETSMLCEIWAADDTTGDLCQAREQLLNNRFRCEGEDETSHLATLIVHKLTYMNEDKKAHHGLPPFFWVDPKGLRRNPDSCLGKGSYGVVFEAVWLGGRFAVKDIFYAEEDTVLETEQAIQARLHHPNVMSLVCCTKEPSVEKCGMVMELMQQNLQSMMKGRKKDGKEPPFTLLEAIDLMLQIAKGMEYLHSLNIMHRDLKSPNILVSFPNVSDGQIGHHTVRLKITDFGMAKAKEMSSYFTTKPTCTLAWRAPELFQNQGIDGHARYKKNADVYSFGLVCYEILTGELPFKETERLSTRVMRGERPQLPPHCPGALASYIQRCWHGNPETRPGFTDICRMLRYFKACILLKNPDDPPNAALNWLALPLSTSKCARITDELEAQKRSIDALSPVYILLEMYWCRMVLQERREACERNRGEGIFEHSISEG
eukprot:c24970_g1_i1 orf=122-1999(+)